MPNLIIMNNNESSRLNSPKCFYGAVGIRNPGLIVKWTYNATFGYPEIVILL